MPTFDTGSGFELPADYQSPKVGRPKKVRERKPVGRPVRSPLQQDALARGKAMIEEGLKTIEAAVAIHQDYYRQAVKSSNTPNQISYLCRLLTD